MIGQCPILLNDLIILALLVTDHFEFWHPLCRAFVAALMNLSPPHQKGREDSKNGKSQFSQAY
jgi:hypothetical protein